MNALKKYLGIVWIILGPAAIIFMFWQAADKIGLAQSQASSAATEAARQAASSAATNTILQWAIIILVFLPIALGMVIFGVYAYKGEYEHIPTSSSEL